MSKGQRRSSTQRLNTSSPNKAELRTEVSAGGLVFKRTRTRVCFAMLMDSYGNWTFSKGHVRRSETYEETARREIGEELGLRSLKMVRRLGKIDIWFRDRFVFKGALVHKHIHYFLFEAPPGAKLSLSRRVKSDEHIKDVAWVPIEDVAERSHYPDLEPIVRRALGYFKRM